MNEMRATPGVCCLLQCHAEAGKHGDQQVRRCPDSSPLVALLASAAAHACSRALQLQSVR